MATPPFILELRKVWGQRPLFLIGVVGVVLDRDQRMLLVRRSDTGRWSLPAGILEPGEQPGAALLRELHEETSVHAELESLALVHTDEPFSYPNGDQVQFLTLVFRARHRSGEPRAADEESIEVAWFERDHLPDLDAEQHERIAAALSEQQTTAFC